MSLENLYMREVIIESLKVLSDRELQLRQWCSQNVLHPFWDNMKFPIEWLLDTLGFSDGNSQAHIGYTLYDKDELGAVVDASLALRRIIDEIGIEHSNEVYLDSPLWQDVIDKSKIALNLLQKNDIEFETN